MRIITSHRGLLQTLSEGETATTRRRTFTTGLPLFGRAAAQLRVRPAAGAVGVVVRPRRRGRHRRLVRPGRGPVPPRRRRRGECRWTGCCCYAAATRWLVAPAPGDGAAQRWQVQLIRGHGGRVGQRVTLEASRERTLRVRWSHDVVRQVREVESHLPERACEVDVGAKPASEVRRRPGSDAKLSGSSAYLRTGLLSGEAPFPLRLMPTPTEVFATLRPNDDDLGRPALIVIGGVRHELAHAAGPRRVAGVWWTCHDKTRDYYDVVTPDGRRFWVFRALPYKRWFLHGTFA